MTTNAKVHRLRLGELLSHSHGRFITVTFVKVNGELRTLTGRFGVRIGLKDAPKHPNHTFDLDKPYKSIWDVKKKAYRSINLATMISVHMRGVHYEVVD